MSTDTGCLSLANPNHNCLFTSATVCEKLVLIKREDCSEKESQVLRGASITNLPRMQTLQSSHYRLLPPKALSNFSQDVPKIEQSRTIKEHRNPTRICTFMLHHCHNKLHVSTIITNKASVMSINETSQLPKEHKRKQTLITTVRSRHCRIKSFSMEAASPSNKRHCPTSNANGDGNLLFVQALLNVQRSLNKDACLVVLALNSGSEQRLRDLIAPYLPQGFTTNFVTVDENDLQPNLNNPGERPFICYVKCLSKSEAADLRTLTQSTNNPAAPGFVARIFGDHQCFVSGIQNLHRDNGDPISASELLGLLKAANIPVSNVWIDYRHRRALLDFNTEEECAYALLSHSTVAIGNSRVLVKIEPAYEINADENLLIFKDLPLHNPTAAHVKKLAASLNIPITDAYPARGPFAIVRVANDEARAKALKMVPQYFPRSLCPKYKFRDNGTDFFSVAFYPAKYTPGNICKTPPPLALIMFLISIYLRKHNKCRTRTVRVAILSTLILFHCHHQITLNKVHVRTKQSAVPTNILRSIIENLCKLITSRYIHYLVGILIFSYLPTASATSLTQKALDDYCITAISAITIITVNIRGMIKDSHDRNQINEFLTKHKPDILVLQETWITKKILKTFPNLTKAFPGYSINISDATESEHEGKRSSGGQILLVKLEYLRDYSITEKLDNRVVEMKLKVDERNTWVLWFTYGPADTNDKPKFWRKVHKLIEKAQHNTGEIPFLMMGDLNIAPYPHIDRNSEKYPANKPESREFSALLDNGLIDIWRDRHPGMKDWTFSRQIKKSYVYTYSCNNCQTDITAETNRCQHCEDFDLCNACYATANHNPSHIFQRTKISINRNEYFETQESRIDLAIGNSLLSQLTEEVQILKTSTIAPDHSPILIRLTLPSERYHMNNPTQQINETLNLDKTKFKDPRSMQFFNTRMQHSQQEASSDLDEEDQNLCSLILKSAHETLGVKKRKPWKPELNYEILNCAKKVKRLRRILRSQNGPRPFGKGKLRRIGKAIAASGTRLASFVDTEEWFTSVAQLLRQEEKALITAKEKNRKEFICKAVDKVLTSHTQNPKQFYRAANADKISVRQQIDSTYVKVEGKMIRTNAPEVVKESVASFWQNIFNKRDISTNNMPWLENNRTTYPRHWAIDIGKEITKEELERTISSLASGKAADIPAELIKNCGPHAKERIRNIMNRAIKEQRIPKSWKKARITLIYKKGDPADLGNYRPITVAPQLYKIFMSIINARFRRGIEANGILLEAQGGCRAGRSTTDKAGSLIQKLMRRKSRAKKLYVAFFDMQKCFDSIDHELILRTLHIMNVPIELRLLFANIYDENNTACIATAYGDTRDLIMKRGIRQGCPFSPTLLNLVLDPILRDLHKLHPTAHLYAYVDDLAVVCKNKEQLYQFCRDLKSTWEKAALLLGEDKNGCSKTAILTDDTSVRPLSIETGVPITIPIVPEGKYYKYLGIQIDPNLNWTPAFEEIDRKLNSTLPYLRARCFTQRQTVDIINTILIPHITYRMALIPGGEDRIKKWENRIAYTVGYKGRIYNWESPKYLYLERRLGGTSLKKLSHEIETARIEAITTFGIWSRDKERATQCAKIIPEITATLRKKDITLHLHEELTETRTYTGGRIPVHLKEVRQAILQMENANANCVHDSTMKILKEKNISTHPVLRFIATRTLPAVKYQLKSRISTDGSKNTQRGTAYAVYSAGYDQFTYAGRVASINDIGRAELFAIVHALIIGANFSETHIYTDSQYALSAYEQAVSDTHIKRKEQDYDLRLLIREIHALRDHRTANVHKVMAHALDHEDLNERKRRFDIMKSQYGTEEARKLISDNQRADELAKWARDRPESPIIQLTHTLSEAEKFALSERNGDKIFSPRKYLRRRNHAKILAEVQSLAHMPWLKEPNKIQTPLSNNLFTRTTPGVAPLQNFVYKMRRKLLYEKAMILNRIESRGDAYAKSKYPNPPDNDKCELCGAVEQWMHPMISCKATKHVREETNMKIIGRFTRMGITRDQAEKIPCWWAADVGDIAASSPDLGNFDKIWGALGIIPKEILTWANKHATNLEQVKAQLAEIHMDILRGMYQSWITRCRKTTWKSRPPDRAIA